MYNQIITPSPPTIMHHHAIFMPPISLADSIIIFLARNPKIRAIKDPIPANHTIEKINPRDKILLTFICNSRFGGISALITIILFFHKELVSQFIV